MQLNEYQQEAAETDQRPGADPLSLVIPLLGIAGEVGSLLVEHKKHLRDGEAHKLYRDHLTEELGDILWYLASIASKDGIELEQVARFNLMKVRDRWLDHEGPYRQFDDDYPPGEQLPRSFSIAITEEDVHGVTRTRMTVDGKPFGDPLRDNAYEDDGYRFHDVFHLAYAAVLGWSPVVRSLLRRKRKSVPEVDDAEDGGRAIVIDEAIVAYVFEYARNHAFFENVEHVDYGVLRTIKTLSSLLEVQERSTRDWELAILKGFEIWRKVRLHSGGIIHADLTARTISYVE